MKNLMLRIILATAVLVSCASLYDTGSPYDSPSTPAPRDTTFGIPPLQYKVASRHYDSLVDPFTEHTQLIHADRLHTMSITKFDTTKGNDFYTLEIVYEGSGWLFITGSVLVKVDDDPPFTIIDKKPKRDVLGGGSVREIVQAIIPVEHVVRMAQANALRVQFFGSPETITDRGVEFLRRFLAEYPPSGD